jgi:DNA-binding SARP family transcriptional activator
VEFCLLGAIEVRFDDRPVHVGYAQLRCVLAVLLVDANHVVSIDQLLDRVWGDRRFPQRPRGAVQHAITLLRTALTGLPVSITWRSTGYELRVDPETIDLHRFHSLINQARTAADDGRAAALFERALGLWRGEPLAGLNTPWLESLRAALTAQRDAAQLDLTDLRRRRGHE